MNESNICDESDILNQTGVDTPAILVWSPDTKVQCRARGVCQQPITTMIPPSAVPRHPGSSCKAAWSGRTPGIDPCAFKFPIAEARWLFYRRLCS
jgi:hypothetical protein